jgi:hypothetical protein
MCAKDIEFISLVEYTVGIPGRVKEGDLSVGGLYMALFVLKDTDKAACFPARIVDAPTTVDDERDEENGQTIGFIRLDTDLRRASKAIYSGIRQGHLDTVMPIPPEYTTAGGYLAGYTDEVYLPPELREMLSNEATVAIHA